MNGKKRVNIQCQYLNVYNHSESPFFRARIRVTVCPRMLVLPYRTFVLPCRFFVSKASKPADQEGIPRGDESMRESFHFTHTLTGGDVSVGMKLEEYDEVESEEKVGSCCL